MSDPEMSDSPVAVTSTGGLLVNLTHITSHGDLDRLAEEATDTGRRVFLGLELTPDEASEALGKLDDAAAEIVATIYRERG